MKIKPQFSSGFELINEGVHIFRVESTDEAKVEDPKEDGNDFNYQVANRVEGGENDGATLTLYFGHKTKGHFGLKRFAGFLIKAGAIPAKDEFDTDSFDTPKFKQIFKGVEGKLWGGRVKHVSGKKEGSNFANITDFYTVKEAQQEMSKGAKKSFPTQADAAESLKGKAEPETKVKEGGGDWD